MNANAKLAGGAMSKFFPAFIFSIIIATIHIAAIGVVQAKEPAKATDRLTSPLDTVEPMAPGSHVYNLVMSKDDRLCRHMLQVFNDDLAKYGYEQYGEHEEFRAIPWQDAQFSRENHGRIEYTPVKGALFDINNDGVKDFVVKWEASLGGILRDGLYILDSEAASRAGKLVNRELFESKNSIVTAGWVYLLGAPLQGEGAYFGILEPFQIGNTTYLYLRPTFELRREQEPPDHYSVIARYKKGASADREHSGEMDDLCYFERVRVDKQ
ncbi:MAG: hypothetical protein IT368_08975 [Candidatus Hydrogenedentes bacterium]|nr:hypothetical protein [Candidatus Hydrogenedentota bacterium]